MGDGLVLRMIEIPLQCGRVALISDIDAELARLYTWRSDEHNASGKPYVKTTVRGPSGRRVTLYLHRVITRCPPMYKADHRDRDTLNNQRPNLRIATHDLNNANRGGWGLSKLKGVYPTGGTWRSRITINGVQLNLGSYPTAIEAAKAYDAASFAQFGHFAFLNFPDDYPLPAGWTDRDCEEIPF